MTLNIDLVLDIKPLAYTYRKNIKKRNLFKENQSIQKLYFRITTELMTQSFSLLHLLKESEREKEREKRKRGRRNRVKKEVRARISNLMFYSPPKKLT